MEKKYVMQAANTIREQLGRNDTGEHNFFVGHWQIRGYGIQRYARPNVQCERKTAQRQYHHSPKRVLIITRSIFKMTKARP